MHPTPRAIATICTLLAGLGCGGGGGGGTGPSGPVDVSGTWAVHWTNMHSLNLVCSLSGTSMTLTQSDSTFSGSLTQGQLDCDDGTSQAHIVFGARPVSNGHVQGRNLQFDLVDFSFHQVGSAGSNSLSGSANWTIDVPPFGFVILNGTWGATR